MLESTQWVNEDENDANTQRPLLICARNKITHPTSSEKGVIPIFYKIFGDFGLNSGGTMTVDEVTGMIATKQVVIRQSFQ